MLSSKSLVTYADRLRRREHRYAGPTCPLFSSQGARVPHLPRDGIQIYVEDDGSGRRRQANTWLNPGYLVTVNAATIGALLRCGEGEVV